MILPYWVGIDKHTPLGKSIIKKVAYEQSINEEIALTLSFYCEGDLINNYNYYFWWEKEIYWRLKQLNIEISEGFKIWNMLKPRLSELLYAESLNVEHKLNNIEVKNNFKYKQQMELF